MSENNSDLNYKSHYIFKKKKNEQLVDQMKLLRKLRFSMNNVCHISVCEELKLGFMVLITGTSPISFGLYNSISKMLKVDISSFFFKQIQPI